MAMGSCLQAAKAKFSGAAGEVQVNGDVELATGPHSSPGDKGDVRCANNWRPAST